MDSDAATPAAREMVTLARTLTGRGRRTRVRQTIREDLTPCIARHDEEADARNEADHKAFRADHEPEAFRRVDLVYH